MPLRPQRRDTIEHMRDAVLFDGPEVRTKLSRFWVLLILSAVIASAGVVGDSTATVIGAMIVAPLMTPILGTMLSVVLVTGRTWHAVSASSSPAPRPRSPSDG